MNRFERILLATFVLAVCIIPLGLIAVGLAWLYVLGLTDYRAHLRPFGLAAGFTALALGGLFLYACLSTLRNLFRPDHRD